MGNDSLRSRLGMFACAVLLCSGCGDDGGGSGDGGAVNHAGSGGGAGGAQHLEMDIEATTSDSVFIEFHCALDYTVDIHGTLAQTEDWVRGYLEGQANSVTARHPFVAIDMDDSLLSDEITMELTDSIVGVPGVYGTSTFVATCGKPRVTT